MEPARGRLIALEGVDGCGKSTQARLLAGRLDALFTREPGGTTAGLAIRSVVLNAGMPLDARAEALLLLADRAQHCAEVIEPALADGRWVVTDRFAASTVAYQGFGRALDPDDLGRFSAWAARSLVPDLYVLVEVSAEVAEDRRRIRDGLPSRPAPADRMQPPSSSPPPSSPPPSSPPPSSPPPDRMESESSGFHRRVAQGYSKQAESDPSRWVVVKGDAPVEEVAARIEEAVVERLGRPGPGSWR